MKFKDEEMLELFAQRIIEGKFKQINHLTNILHFFAKMKWQNKNGDEYIGAALKIMLKEPKLKAYTACRNLWNLYALDYYDKPAMERFSRVILETKPD